MYKFGPELDPETVAWLENGPRLPETLVVHLGDRSERRYKILDRDEAGVIEALRTGRRGRKGFVLRVQDTATSDEYAAKLCIPEDYADKPPVTEIEFSRALSDIQELVLLPKLLGGVDRFEGEPRYGNKPGWICFISDWLKGDTLRELIDNSPDEITPALFVQVAENLITSILVMQDKGYKHDDLNLGNLMIQEVNATLAAINPLRAIRRLRIIDLGSMKPFDRATAKTDDDWSLTAKCLAELHNVMHRNRALASQYPSFLKSIRAFIQDLADEPSRKFPDPGDYVRRVDQARQLITIEPRAGKIFHPLEAISAEHLADDQILLQLFVKHLPWLSLVQAPNPCVLIGPRGCGKSMVFRYMATKTHITSKECKADVLNESGIFGVYVGCSSDLGHDLVWLSRKRMDIAAYVDQITDYFNLVVARELMRAIASSASAMAFIDALGITEQAKLRVVAFLEETLQQDMSRIHVSGMEIFQSCADTLDRLRLRLAREMRSGPGVGVGTGATFLRDLCTVVVASMPAFETYKITFLLDDYTEHRISKEVQEILNGIVFQRVPCMVFKVSSEPYGFDSATFFGTRLDPTREYNEIDAGTKCLEMSATDRRRFVTELLNSRLKTASYLGRAETLIGDSECDTDPKLAAAICAQRKGKQTYYNGLDVLSNAWSGDVATVLHIVDNMFAYASVNSQSQTRIPNAVQHSSIVRVSKGLRGRVQGFSPFGHEMSNILAAFGDLAATLLIEHRAKTRRVKDGLNRKYRIEWTLPAGADTESELASIDPGGQHYLLYKELVRRAVFHESLQSRGKEGPGRRTVRLQVRSSLLPSFGTSLIHENHLKIDKAVDFVEFLTNTRRWAKSVIARYSTPNDMFGADLFDEEEDGDE
jgi:hypothetical protein